MPESMCSMQHAVGRRCCRPARRAVCSLAIRSPMAILPSEWTSQSAVAPVFRRSTSVLAGHALERSRSMLGFLLQEDQGPLVVVDRIVSGRCASASRGRAGSASPAAFSSLAAIPTEQSSSNTSRRRDVAACERLADASQRNWPMLPRSFEPALAPRRVLARGDPRAPSPDSADGWRSRATKKSDPLGIVAAAAVASFSVNSNLRLAARDQQASVAGRRVQRLAQDRHVAGADAVRGRLAPSGDSRDRRTLWRTASSTRSTTAQHTARPLRGIDAPSGRC